MSGPCDESSRERVARARARDTREREWALESERTGIPVDQLREAWFNTPEGRTEGRIFRLVAEAPDATEEQVAALRRIFSNAPRKNRGAA